MARLSSPFRSFPCPARSFVLVSRSFVLMAAVAACALSAGESLGCPNCKDAVNTSDPEGLNVARGYFYSILIMLAMPCTLISSFGIYVWREMQRQKQAGLSPGGQSFGGSPVAEPSAGRPSSGSVTLPHP